LLKAPKKTDRTDTPPFFALKKPMRRPVICADLATSLAILNWRLKFGASLELGDWCLGFHSSLLTTN
jgi:hypothetical protein